MNSTQMSKALSKRGLELAPATVRTWFARGAPTNSAARFQKFHSANKASVGDPENRQLKKEINGEELRRMKRENDKADGKVIDRDVVKSGAQSIMATLFNELSRVFENELPPLTEGLKAIDIRKKNSKAISELRALLKEKFLQLTQAT